MVKLDTEAVEKLLQFKKKSENFFNENNKFLHHKMARHLIQQLNIIILDERIHYYNGKKYVNDDNRLKTYMTSIIENIKENQRNEVIHSIRYMAEEKEQSSSQYIGMQNGIYDIEQDQFIEHSPNYVFTSLINAEYNPTAYCENVDKLFKLISQDDEEIIQLLKEMIAYTIYRENTLEKSFLLKGEAGSGKSTLLNMIAAFLGDENISSLSLSQLDGQFYTGLLKDKLANIGDDINYTTIRDTSSFKKLSTGERLQGEMKNENPFQFRSFAKLIFSANRVPRMNDGSKALIDRFVIVPLNARIRGTNKQDPDFEKKITTDESKSYLLNIAIETLKELLEKGRFAIPHIVHEELKEFDVMNDPIKEWLSEFEEEGKDLHNLPVGSAYAQYKDFCEHNGFKYPVSNKKLTQELKQHGYESNLARIGGNKPQRIYQIINSIDL